MRELDDGWQLIEGKRNILVVAGHNFNQGREGKIKLADLGTGDIARKICDQFGFWGIISTRKQLDPNWYPNSPFREKIKETIKEKNIDLIIDIHGKSLGAEKLIELKGNDLFKSKYKIVTGDFLKNDQQTLAEEMNETVPVLQVEIREDGRIRTINEEGYFEAEKEINGLINKLL